MPLPERLIEPVSVSRGTLQYPVPDELEGVTNGTLANIIRQLSSVSRHAEEMFGNLFYEAEAIAQRSSHVQARIDRLAVKVTQLDSTVEEVSLQDIHQKRAFRSSQTFDQQVVSRETMPKAMLEAYLACDKPPPLDNLNPYRDDGKDGLKFYTDPNYFFELWRQEMLKDTERVMHDKGRKHGQGKGHHVHGNGTSSGEKHERNKKKIRNPSNTAEKQRQKAMNRGEYIVAQSDYNPNNPMRNSQGGPTYFNGDQMHQPHQMNGGGIYPGMPEYAMNSQSSIHHRPNNIDLHEPNFPLYSSGPAPGGYQGYNPTQEPIYTPRILRNDNNSMPPIHNTSVVAPASTTSNQSHSSRPINFEPVNALDVNRRDLSSVTMGSGTSSYQSGFMDPQAAMTLSPQGTPTRRPNQPPPAPPPTTTDSFAGGVPQQLRENLNSSLPPPPMMMSQIQNGNGLMDLSSSSGQGDVDFLPPPPPVPKQENFHQELVGAIPPALAGMKSQLDSAPSPPPPPVSATSSRNTDVTTAGKGTSDSGIAVTNNGGTLPTGAPPPPPPPPPAPGLILNNGSTKNLDIKKISPGNVNGSPSLTDNGGTQGSVNSSPKKPMMPAQPDIRSDLLKAIRDGIALRRVEQVGKEEEQSNGKEGGTADVASILARRVAVEMSDSDDAGAPTDSEYDSDDWGDESTA
ncbi:hypothetical protein TCAL_09586 [Tigriopus californicus]|uniref:Wiskott-Aldrich syndrome protein family member n=1 Tax=Tigriopus californicus TaxID=6832 RepID=A0A553PGV7_TIGCA|nr:actin-binding protein WASF3-like isoform X2 [Tigriopus californicus]TRY76894.1 hypothetical protein TCAL_09586 [Tigriopus californicus]